MFWDNFTNLCIKHNKKPNPVAKELGISSGSVTSWKNGAIPHHITLKKIADYFDVTVDDLLHDPTAPARVVEGSSLGPQKTVLLACFDRADERDRQVLWTLLDKYLTPEERALLTQPPLGSEQNGKIRLYAAASSTDRHPDGYIDKDKNEWDKIRTAPDTDDPLL